MNQVYGALHGIDGIDWMKLFTLAPSNTTRGHSLKLFRKQCRTSQRLHSFSIKVIDEKLTQVNTKTYLSFTAKSCLTEDRISKQILDDLQMSIQDKNPAYVSENGNCLFSALSVSIVGNERLATQLRVLTCIEMVTNKSLYDNRKYVSLRDVSPSYSKACKEAGTNKAFSSAWAMLAASSVVSCPIQSVYPPRNGFLDKAIGILHTIFNPMGAKTRDTIAVMWSSGSYE